MLSPGVRREDVHLGGEVLQHSWRGRSPNLLATSSGRCPFAPKEFCLCRSMRSTVDENAGAVGDGAVPGTLGQHRRAGGGALDTP